MFHNMIELSSLVTYLRWIFMGAWLVCSIEQSMILSLGHYWNPTKFVLVRNFGLIGIFIKFIPFCFLVWHYTLLMQLPLEIWHCYLYLRPNLYVYCLWVSNDRGMIFLAILLSISTLHMCPLLVAKFEP